MSNENDPMSQKSLQDGESNGENIETNLQNEKEKETMKQKEITEQLKEKQEEIEKMKNIIENFQGKKCSVAEAFTSVKQMLGEFSGNLTLQTDDNSKEKVMKRMEDELRQCVDFLQTRELSPAEVIENSTAVHGTFCTKNIDDWIEPRRKMVNIGRNVKFRTPTLTQRDDIVEHDSKSSSNEFDKAVEKSGCSLAVELKVPKSIVGGAEKNEGELQEENKSQNSRSSNTSYFCKSTYSVVPVALWTASLSDLSLSVDIIDDLKRAEHLINIQEKGFAKEKVKNIFQIYGSHFYCGSIHYGGLFHIKTEFQSDKESTRSSIYELVSKAHSASVNACSNVFGILQIGGSASDQNQYGIENEDENHKSFELSKIHTSLTKLGGPVEINSLGLWKKGLVQNNSSWVVVDGGKPTITEDQLCPKAFVGLWNLVQRESSLFENSIVLSNLLLDTWHEISGLHVPVDLLKIDKIHWHKSKICAFIEQNACKELTSGSCVEIFKILSTIVQECGTDIGQHSVWIEELRTNDGLHTLLKKILTVNFEELDAIETSHQVNKLLGIASDVHFSERAAVLNCLKQIEKPNAKLLRDDNINSIDSFFVEINASVFLKNIASNDKCALALLTGEVATVIEQLLKQFRTENALLEYLVLVSFVILLEFDVKESKLRVQLNSDKLSECIGEVAKMQEELIKFRKIGSCDKVSQALLFQNIIQSIKSVTKHIEHLNLQSKQTILRNMRFHETSKHILEHFSFLIDKSIQTAITQNDINDILDTLKEIAEGQGPVSQSPMSWTYFENITEYLQETNNLNEHNSESLTTGYTVKDVERNMDDILKTFGLKKYFPEQITVQMALSIHDQTSATTNETDIPWKILKNIISANSDFREKILKEFWNTLDTAQNSHEDLLDDLSSSDEDDTSQTQTYHPSDVFLGIFQCCNPFLKRLIVTKLSFCQFAVPILFTDYTNNDLVFSTWPINDIVLHGDTETMITKARNSVAFIRVGKGSVPSKSKLINEFLRDFNEEHATFIHKDCPLGMNRRTVSKGMIEMSWLVPDQQSSSNQPNPNDKSYGGNIREPLNIFNLRGDAMEFDRQLNILPLLSNLIVISISYDDLHEEKFRSVLQKVHKSKTSVIVLTNMGGSKEDKTFLRVYIKEMNIDKSKTRVISTMDKKKDVSIEPKMMSSSDLKEILTNNIVKLLEHNLEAIQIQKVTLNLPEGICSDESPKCIIGRRLADSLFKSCELNGNPENRRDTYLPIQGKSLWHEISKKEKDIKRTKLNVVDKEETIIKHIRQLRRKQTDICNNAPDAFSIFVETLLKYTEDEEVLQYFIIWFKQMLNNQSRVLLKDLLQKFSTAFKKHESTKDNTEKGSKSKEELDKTEQLLAKASFGVEHFFREIGQVYEAFMHTSEDLKCRITHHTKEILTQLPFVVAKLLLLGHPFEIMDGDAANVPQKWVAAVLKEVQNIVGSKTKIVTVSVLGIQSSGKSTLLNTMFGLEFSVSAGRCTRGIYMQLVPVNNFEKIQADYLLVLDTEGLRAPECAGEKIHHDNEIATLVVGLADVVLLNLKGESISDMANVLEIVITGLLRLQQVNKNLTLRQSCIFIHQNVSKDAQLQLLQGNRHIVENLDTMTKDVAIQEKITDIKHFADVIKFNPTEDIRYIPELFHGSPGMGPVNQKYSLEVTGVQKCILREKAPVIQPVTFENYLLHLQSLWQGIQAEDFIFSFRNILEIKSYGILESEYQRLIWELEELKLEWMNNNIKPRLQCCKDVVSIDKCARTLIRECRNKMDEKYEESDELLKEFVKKSELQEHMEHYIAEKCYNMKSKKMQFEQDTLQSIQQEKEKCTSKLSREDILTLKEKQITATARKLAKDFSGKKPTREETNYEFEKLWTQFLNELASELPQNTLAEKTEIMKCEIETTLNELYSKYRQLLRNSLKECAIDNGPIHSSLWEGLKKFRIDQDHISVAFTDKVKNIYNRYNFKDQALNVIGEVFLDIDQDFANLLVKDTEYNQSQFSAIMKRVITKFKSINLSSSNYCFTLTPALEMSVALRVARHSFHMFENMNKTYENTYGLQARLEAKRPRVHQLFLDTCEKQAEEIIATKLLCDELKISIEEKLRRELSLKMHREIVQKFNCQKHHLMKSVMEELATIGKFDAFIKYIRNPETYVKRWLTQKTNNEIFLKNHSNRSSYTSWLEVTITDIIDKIKSSSKLTTEQSYSNMRDWIECFQQEIKSSNLALILNNTSFQLLSDHDIKNFERFLLSIFKKLSELEIELVKIWTGKKASDFTWPDESPYDLTYNFLWGCSSKCPWCSEPCQKSDTRHGSQQDCHNCIQHRPNGVSGTYFKPTGKLTLESCNFAVQSTLMRSCGKWCECPNDKCTVYHPSREYKTHMAEWDISPLADMSNSKYWNWFMKTYSKELVNYYGHEMPTFPSSWESLTKEDAIQSLSEVYLIT